jgi:anti-sigma regulatory factor (Ser/Thr protein kinase)
VSGRVRGRKVQITVRDFGAWRTGRGDDQGRGLALMHALMDRVEVTPTDDGTTVRMERTLERNGARG